jgi:hypothetical protein
MSIEELSAVSASFGLHGVTVEALLQASKEGSTALISPFLCGEAIRRLVRHGHIHLAPSLLEEAVCALRARYLALAPEFRPSRQDPSSGEWRSQGYGAYQRVFLRFVWAEIAEALRYFSAESLAATDEHGLPESLRSESGLEGMQIAEVIASALRSGLRDARRWDFFHSITYRGLSLRELARKAGCEGMLS